MDTAAAGDPGTTPAADATDPGPHVPQWTFADRLRKVRFDVLGLHQAELAAELGVTKAAFAAWESGRTTPRNILAVARMIESISRVPAAWLLGVDSPVDPPPGKKADPGTTRGAGPGLSAQSWLVRNSTAVAA